MRHSTELKHIWHHQRSAEWLGKMKQVFPQMFVHWRFGGSRVG